LAPSDVYQSNCSSCQFVPASSGNSRSAGISGIPWVGSPTFREIKPHQNADKSYKDEGVALLDLARNAQRLFANQEPREKRRLLNFILSNCTWEDGEVVATFRQPFDLLAETAASAARAAVGQTAKTEIWLGD
jgi:hypothetical protein